jgi:hypothetical protein
MRHGRAIGQNGGGKDDDQALFHSTIGDFDVEASQSLTKAQNHWKVGVESISRAGESYARGTGPMSENAKQ